MSATPPVSTPMTAEELVHVSYPDKVTELIRGQLVVREPPGTRHGAIASRLTHFVTDFVYRNRLGVVFAQDTGFHIESNPDTVRPPDLAFLAKERAAAINDRGYARVAPDLVAEVLSPDDRLGEVRDKVADWMAAGVKLVWVIDPRPRTADVYRPNGSISKNERSSMVGRCCRDLPARWTSCSSDAPVSLR